MFQILYLFSRAGTTRSVVGSALWKRFLPTILLCERAPCERLPAKLHAELHANLPANLHSG